MITVFNQVFAGEVYRLEVRDSQDVDFYSVLDQELQSLVQLRACVEVYRAVEEIVIAASVFTYHQRDRIEMKFEYLLEGEAFLTVLNRNYTQTVVELHDAIFRKIANNYKQPQLLSMLKLEQPDFKMV